MICCLDATVDIVYKLTTGELNTCSIDQRDLLLHASMQMYHNITSVIFYLTLYKA